MGLMDRWTDGEREAPEPLEGPIRGTVIVGTAIWFVLFLAQLPFYGWYWTTVTSGSSGPAAPEAASGCSASGT